MNTTPKIIIGAILFGGVLAFASQPLIPTKTPFLSLFSRWESTVGCCVSLNPLGVAERKKKQKTKETPLPNPCRQCLKFKQSAFF